VAYTSNPYLLIFNSISEPVFLIDDTLHIVEINLAMEKIVGIPKKEVIGRECSQVVLCCNCKHCPINEAIGEREPRSNIEAFIQSSGGEKHIVLMNATPVNGVYDINSGAVVSLQDITHVKFLQRELKKTLNFRSIEILTKGIAHDFNNLLMAISGNIFIAKELVSPDDTINKYLDDTEKAVLKSQELVNKLCDFSKYADNLIN
jgi:two-component system, cell cycle sensor histidine kinase and response regulator CckA